MVVGLLLQDVPVRTGDPGHPVTAVIGIAESCAVVLRGVILLRAHRFCDPVVPVVEQAGDSPAFIGQADQAVFSVIVKLPFGGPVQTAVPADQKISGRIIFILNRSMNASGLILFFFFRYTIQYVILPCSLIPFGADHVYTVAGRIILIPGDGPDHAGAAG